MAGYTKVKNNKGRSYQPYGPQNPVTANAFTCHTK